MARKESPIVGIDLNEQEIRIVELTPKAGKPCITKAASAEMPGGAFVQGRLLNSASVAFAVRRLLDSMGCGSVDQAVFATQNSRTSYRQFTIPPVPDSELDAIVSIEVDHHQFVGSRGGSYGAIKLTPPAGSDSHDAATVACFGVEEEETAGIREVADRAGLKVAAVEPATLSMLRAATLAQSNSPVIFNLSVGNSTTDASFLIGGQLVAFRRLDIGESALVDQMLSRVAYGTPHSDRFLKSDTGDGKDLMKSAVSELALEVRRTLDYLAREYPDFAVIDRVSVSYMSPEIESLSGLLSERLSIPCFNVLPTTGANDSSGAIVELSGEQAGRYAVAYGLAMYAAPLANHPVKRIDLFNQQRSTVLREESQRNFAGSILVTMLALVVGLLGYYFYGQQIQKVQADTGATQARTSKIQSQINQAQLEQTTKINQYRALRKEGLPIGVVMDYAVASIAPGVGLTNLSVTPDLKVAIQGEALDERGLLDTVENLKKTPVFKDLSIVSFARPAKSFGTTINFQLTGDTISSNKIRLSVDPPSDPTRQVASPVSKIPPLPKKPTRPRRPRTIIRKALIKPCTPHLMRESGSWLLGGEGPIGPFFSEAILDIGADGTLGPGLRGVERTGIVTSRR